MGNITNFRTKKQPASQGSQPTTGDNDEREKTYFNLITNGVGYLNRFRTVKPKKGDPYMSVTIAAMEGEKGDPNYTTIDCAVVGETALAICQELENEINNRDDKVMIGFSVGGLLPSSYVSTSGKNQGQRRHLIKSRLLGFKFVSVKVDGASDYERVYDAPKPDESDVQDSTDDTEVA